MTGTLELRWRVRPGRECRICGEPRLARMVKARTAPDGHHKICHPCQALAARERRARLGTAEVARRRKEARPRLRRHGLTTADKLLWLDATGWACFACRRPFESAEEAYVDHDHRCCPTSLGSCGKCRRGLLCHACNTSAGLLGDDPDRLRALADYLAQGHPARGRGTSVTTWVTER